MLHEGQCTFVSTPIKQKKMGVLSSKYLNSEKRIGKNSFFQYIYKVILQIKREREQLLSIKTLLKYFCAFLSFVENVVEFT